MLVIVPPQTFCEITEKLGWSGGVTEFYRLYVTGFDGWRPGGRHLVVPTWNHLWFVPYLWVYTMIVIRSEEHTSELQSLMRISYAVFCLKTKKINYTE